MSPGLVLAGSRRGALPLSSVPERQPSSLPPARLREPRLISVTGACERSCLQGGPCSLKENGQNFNAKEAEIQTGWSFEGLIPTLFR